MRGHPGWPFGDRAGAWLDFLADDSVQRILLIAGGVLALFAVYFGLAVASNRSVRQLAQIIRRRTDGSRRVVEVRSASPFLRARWAILVLLAVMAGLIAFLVWTTSALH